MLLPVANEKPCDMNVSLSKIYNCSQVFKGFPYVVYINFKSIILFGKSFPCILVNKK